MINRDTPIGRTAFTEAELSALQALQTRYRPETELFTGRELARLRFLRWLVRRPAWNCGPNQTRGARTPQVPTASAPAMDAWVYRLKAAYDGGYYRSESSVGEQTSLPWQSETCDNCPFWSITLCRVLARHKWSATHTCMYFERG